MTSQTRIVELTHEQIAFVRESLNYSAKAFRNASYKGQDRKWVAQHRSERDALITSIRRARRRAVHVAARGFETCCARFLEVPLRGFEPRFPP